MAAITRELMLAKIDRKNEMKASQKYIDYQECKEVFLLSCERLAEKEPNTDHMMMVEKITMLYGAKVVKCFNNVFSERMLPEVKYCPSILLPDYFSIAASNLRTSHQQLQKSSQYKAYAVAKAAFKKHRKQIYNKK